MHRSGHIRSHNSRLACGEMKLQLLAVHIIAVSAGTPRLQVVNGCHQKIWLTHLANVGVGPGPQNAVIEPGGTLTFDETETDGLAGSRYWPKMGCDAQGNNCVLGGSGGPNQGCTLKTPDYSSCAPPIDTKFEATWGRQGEPCDPATNKMSGCDFVDVSLVDGFTLPFKLEVLSGTCTGRVSDVKVVDCSSLSVSQCPTDDNLGAGPINMQAFSPKIGKPVGCYAPCLKKIDTKWNNFGAKGKSRNDPDVTKYCCTTPPETSQTCNAGPLPQTKYVQTVHQHCPGVYAFAYDDGQGLMRCSYGQYKLTFMCPDTAIPDRLYEDEENEKEETPEIHDALNAVGAITLLLVAGFLGLGLAVLGIRRVHGIRFRRSRQHHQDELDVELMQE